MVPEAWNEPGNAGVVRKRYIDRSVLLYIYIYIYIYIYMCVLRRRSALFCEAVEGHRRQLARPGARVLR